MEALDINKRQKIALAQLRANLETQKVRANISQQVHQTLQDAHKKHILKEQLKEIHKELGFGEDRFQLVQQYKEKLSKLVMPEKIRALVEAEIERMGALESVSYEFNIMRNYLDWLVGLPWQRYKKENLQIEHAKKILDSDHYGLKDVKERILEFIAVRNLQEKTGSSSETGTGKIICLVGPPGVGQHSLLFHCLIVFIFAIHFNRKNFNRDLYCKGSSERTLQGFNGRSE